VEEETVMFRSVGTGKALFRPVQKKAESSGSTYFVLRAFYCSFRVGMRVFHDLVG
jgi:hypothetical protein